MGEREAFIRSICENPADGVARLVFADWLSENGDEKYAEFIRTQVELARPDPTPPVRPSSLGIIARIAFPFGGAIAAQNRMERYQRELGEYTEAMVKRKRMLPREKQLLSPGSWTDLLGEGTGWTTDLNATLSGNQPVVAWHRGFAHTAICMAELWLKHADALVWNHEVAGECPATAHPIVRVVLHGFDYRTVRINEFAMHHDSERHRAGFIKRNEWESYRWPGVVFELGRVPTVSTRPR